MGIPANSFSVCLAITPILFLHQLDSARTSLLSFPKVILSLPFRSTAVLDGIDGTMVVTAHTHRAVAVPFWKTVFQSDIL